MDKPIAIGATAEIFPWKKGQVLKLFYAPISMQTVEREAHIARTIHASGLPVPGVGGIIGGTHETWQVRLSRGLPSKKAGWRTWQVLPLDIEKIRKNVFEKSA